MALDSNVATNKPLLDNDGKLNVPGVLRKSFYNKNDNASLTDTCNRVLATDISYSTYFTFEQFKSFIKKNSSNQPITYKHMPGEYSLYAWYKVIDDDGNTEPTPYNFTNRVEEDIRLKAKWVQVGKYSFAYNPTMGSTGITGDMARYNDPLESNRYYVDGASAIVLQAPTNLRVDAQTLPEGYETNINPNEFIFRGWRIVDTDGKPLEDNVFYNPGDNITVHANYADTYGNVIHMEAFYERKESTVRRVDDTSLTLHANLPNQNNGDTVNSEGLDSVKNAHANLTDKTLVLDRQQVNAEIHLANYSKNFSNTNGYKLIGWNSDPNATGHIPEYCVDAVVGIDNKTPIPNDLYAVWEPLVYLTLKNDTNSPISFNLEFKNPDASSYNGQIYVAEDHLRYACTDETKNIATYDSSSGKYTVTLTAGQEVKLVIPNSVITNQTNYTYTVSGTVPSTPQALYLYNSGGDSGSYNRNTNYTTNGKLIPGTQGQYVMFSETDPTTTLHVMARYYDTTDGTWHDVSSGNGPQVTPAFELGSAPATQGNDGYSVKLINNNESVKFGLNLTGTASDYKFIGWYTAPEAKPNEPTIDGNTGFGDSHVTGISVPLNETTYYALYVPYMSGTLNITHSVKENSAAPCDATEGLKLTVNETTISGNKDNPPQYSLAVDENNLNDTDTISITVGAKAGENGFYDATYLGEDKVTTAENGNYHEYTNSFLIKNQLVSSDSVKGLMVLKDIHFYSEFSLGYEITYTYTARDGRSTNYVITGRLPNYDETEFKKFVIEKTPYTRTLTRDTIWDTDNLKPQKTDSAVTATLKEVPNVRGVCIVKVNLDPVRYETVPYGKTFTKEQAVRRIAPETNGNLLFDHWAIYNTDVFEAAKKQGLTDEEAKQRAKISDCYDREFHFAVWNNYTIEPVYSSAPTGDPAANWQFVTIDYIDTSRNQWGEETINGENDPNRTGVTDKVVVDLDIAFNDGTNLILDSFDSNGNYAYKLGVIFEKVGTTDANGAYNAASYKSSEDESKVKLRVRDVLGKQKDSSSATDNYYNTTSGYYYTRININEDTVSDFNRAEFARSFTTANVKDNVFRVYAYMVLPGNGDNTVDDSEIIISDPYYMTVYDYATKLRVL